MHLHNFSDEKLAADLAEMLTLAEKTVDPNRKRIYTETLRIIRAEIRRRKGIITAEDINQFSLEKARKDDNYGNQEQQNPPADFATQRQDPSKSSAALQAARPNARLVGWDVKPNVQFDGRANVAEEKRQTVENESGSAIRAVIDRDPHNPTISIKWDDGYSLQVDESACKSRFISTLRDSANLECMDQERFDRIWRWNSPWRAVGFYKGLIYFWGKAPSLHQLNITRPSERLKKVFPMVYDKAVFEKL